MLILWIVLILFCPLISTDDHEFRVYEMLRRRWYNRWERPVRKFNDTIVVTMQLILQQIVQVDEKNQLIELNVWLKYQWTDYKLTWIPDHYGNVTNVRLEVGAAWQPDILVSNSAEKDFHSIYPSLQQLYFNGQIVWIPPAILKCMCQINSRWFPFDTQFCYIKFGSWSYDEKALDLLPEDPLGADTSEYSPNDQWRLVNTSVVKTPRRYKCCVNNFTTVTYCLKIKRRPMYYLMNLILPSLMIMIMCVLALTLHPESGQKMTIEITTLVSVCLFLTVVTSMTPTTSEAVPIVTIYFTSCLILTCASVSCTAYALSIHYKSGVGPMSNLTKTVFLLWLPRLLFMQRGTRRRAQINNLDLSGFEDDAEMMPHVPSALCQSNGSLGSMASLLEQISDKMATVTEHMKKEEELQQTARDWRFMALVMDRLFLIVFTIFFGAISVGALMSSQFN